VTVDSHAFCIDVGLSVWPGGVVEVREGPDSEGQRVTILRGSESTRAAIVEAARQLLTERGEAGVKVRSVCQRVGMTTGALYGYFPTREHLISAAYASELTRSIAAFADAFNDAPGGDSGAVDQSEEISQVLSEHGRALRLAWLAATLRAQYDPALMVVVSAEQRRLMTVLADRVALGQTRGIVDGDLDPLAVAAVTFGSSLGVSAMWPLFADKPDFGQRVADVWARMKFRAIPSDSTD